MRNSTTDSTLVAVNPRWYELQTDSKDHKKNKAGPSRRWGHSTALADNRLIIYGGTGYTTNSRVWESIYQLDLETWEWNKVEPANKAPSSRDSHSCIVYNNKLYIFGGSVGNESKNDMYEYDLSTNLWKKIEPQGNVPTPREGHAACLLDNRYMVIYGGWNGEETFDNCYLFDIHQRRWIFVEKMLGIKPLPMESQSCCMVRRDMYFFGGQGNNIVKDGENFDNFYNELHRLRIRFDDGSRTQVSATWDKIEPKGIKPSKRSSHSSCSYKDRYVFIIGGEGYPADIDEDKQLVEYRRIKKDENSDDYPCFPKNDVWAYDVELNEWSKLKIKNEADFVPRFAHSNVIYKDFLVVFGGLHDYHHSTNDIHVLSLDGSNPFQPKVQPRVTRLSAELSLKEEESQSERSSTFHYESESKEREPIKNFGPSVTTRRANALQEKPKVELLIPQKQLEPPELPDQPEIIIIPQDPIISMNFVCSLSHALSWPLAAFGLFLDNSIIIGAKSFHVNYLIKERKRNIKEIIDEDSGPVDQIGYLVIEDDGSGWGHEEFIKILSTYDTDNNDEQIDEKKEEPQVQQGEEIEKVFNSEEEQDEKVLTQKNQQQQQQRKEDPKLRKINEYAFNFKVASMRLGKNIIFITNNQNEVSLGFLTADRRFNPNLHKNHVFYFSWKKGTGEYLTKRAEKNKNIIQNALKGMFLVQDLIEDIDKIGNRIVIMDLNSVMSFAPNNKGKPDMELLRVVNHGPDNLNDVMVRSLDKNLKVFYRNPSESLIDLSLRTYFSHFFLDPSQTGVEIFLNKTPVSLVNVKQTVESQENKSQSFRINCNGDFGGLILTSTKIEKTENVQNGVMDQSNLENKEVANFKESFNQGVLVYYKNRLIRRLENAKMGNLDFLSSQYRIFLRDKEHNLSRLLFERSGYIELMNEFKPNAFKTEIENPFYSNYLHAMVMSQLQGGLNGKRKLEENEVEEDQVVKKVKENLA